MKLSISCYQFLRVVALFLVGLSLVSAPVAWAETGEDSLIPINTADAQVLMKLKGIGPVMADRIIQHRQENGPFRSVEDLLSIRGIGPKKLKAIKLRIKL